MKLIDKKITKEVLQNMAENSFGNLVKAVVDIEKEVMVIDGELHADEEAFLLEKGSKQANLWGINLYPDKKREEFIEFDSMINVRPSVNNMSRSIEDEKLKERIVNIVNKLVDK